MESALISLYDARGKNLRALIESTGMTLDNTLANRSRLQSLRVSSNVVLHLEEDQTKNLDRVEADSRKSAKERLRKLSKKENDQQENDLKNFENEILSFLKVLRALIENAPRK